MPDYVICYDISDPRRLARLHRHLRRRALAIQYSVFLMRCDARRIDDELAEAATLIDPRADDLRCYRLPERGFAARLGAAVLPEGILLTDLPAPLVAPAGCSPDDGGEDGSPAATRAGDGTDHGDAPSRPRRQPARRRGRRRPRRLRRDSFLLLR